MFHHSHNPFVILFGFLLLLLYPTSIFLRSSSFPSSFSFFLPSSSIALSNISSTFLCSLFSRDVYLCVSSSFPPFFIQHLLSPLCFLLLPVSYELDSSNAFSSSFIHLQLCLLVFLHLLFCLSLIPLIPTRWLFNIPSLAPSLLSFPPS